MRKKIDMLLAAPGINVVELAKRMGTSSQNLYNKFSRNNFKVQDLKEIASAVEAQVVITFVTKDGTEI